MYFCCSRSKDKGEEKANIGEREKAGPTVNDEAPVGKIVEEGDEFIKREISTEEVTEFLRIIQQSEFKVIEQNSSQDLFIRAAHELRTSPGAVGQNFE